MGSMALIVFLRGINVGGHRAFRPSVLAKELGIYDAVNVGAAGTLVIRKPGLRRIRHLGRSHGAAMQGTVPSMLCS